MELNTNHSSFKGAEFYTGNASTPFQKSQMISSKVTPNGYLNQPTLEEYVDFEIKQVGKFLPIGLKEKIKKNALNGISQTVYEIRSSKSGKNKTYGIILVNNIGELIEKHYYVRGRKGETVVDEITKMIIDKQKATYKKFKAQGREHILLS